MMDDEELASLERPATSLFQALGGRPDRNALLVACIESVIAATVSAALLPARRVMTVSRVLRSCSTSSGLLRLQMTRSASQ